MEKKSEIIITAARINSEVSSLMHRIPAQTEKDLENFAEMFFVVLYYRLLRKVNQDLFLELCSIAEISGPNKFTRAAELYLETRNKK